MEHSSRRFDSSLAQQLKRRWKDPENTRDETVRAGTFFPSGG
jgi:hypothetical protein